MSFKKWLLMSMLLLIVGRAASQDTCPAVVQEALESLDTNCELTERNQACYGNIALTATPQSDVPQLKFDAVGDIANLVDISTLDLEPLDTASGQWGLAMLKVQADIPDSMPGQNVTFVLFGDVTIENTAQEGQTPMQAFYLTTGIGDSNCAEAPDSGLMVQTPSGVKEVAFNVNGVDVEMGSTVIFQAKRGEQMRVKTVEGKARLTVDDEIIPVVQGSEYIAPIDDEFKITDEGTLLPYHEDEVRALPIVLLEREIEIAPPLTEDQIEEVKTRERDGELLCSDEDDSFLPPCTKPLYDARGQEVQFDENGNVRLVDDNGEPLFYDREGQPITDVDDYYRYYSYWTDSSTLKDEFGNTINVREDGTVLIEDRDGNIFEASRNGTYTYIGVNGERYTFDDATTTENLFFDDEGRPVLRDEEGTIFTTDPDERDPGIILPETQSAPRIDPTREPPSNTSDREVPPEPPDSDREEPSEPPPSETGGEEPQEPPHDDSGREEPSEPPHDNPEGEAPGEPPPGEGEQGSTTSRDEIAMSEPEREVPGNQASNDPTIKDSDRQPLEDSGREIPPPTEEPKRG